MERKLYRSRKNRVISGVCGGLGEYFNIDPVLVRVLFIIALFPLHFFLLFTYVILWVIVPEEKLNNEPSTDSPSPRLNGRSPQNSRVFSFFVAAVLIIAGISILLSSTSFFRFYDVAFYLIALFLFFVGIKLIIDVFQSRVYSLARFSAGMIAITLGIYFVLNRLSFIDSGVYIEYFKNLIPAFLILFGITVILKNYKLKWIALILAFALFVFAGVFSYIKGNYAPFGMMGKMMEKMGLPYVGKWTMNYGNINTGSFSGTYDFNNNIEGLEYHIENLGGKLDVGDTEKLMEYSGAGISPNISTNESQKIFYCDFGNHAAETAIKLCRLKKMNLSLNVTGGNLSGSLSALDIGHLSLKLTGGSAAVSIGENTKEFDVGVSEGSAKIELPRNCSITVRPEKSIANLNLPSAFQFKNGEYIYEGGGKKILINATVKMGNLELEF